MEKSRKGKSRSKKTLPYQAKLNSAYQKHSLKKHLEDAFTNKIAFKNEDLGVELLKEPFQACVLPSFIKDQQFLEGLRDELFDQIFHDKNNDLYKFQQTDDLAKVSAPHVKALRKFLFEDVVDWLRDVTGIPLTDQIDMTCSRYDYTDVLLCHDDELDTRRIAFILYLVPPWKPEDGGSLDLFAMDKHGQPDCVVRSLYPQWNQFTWFEVTEASHHQVSEILAEDKTRLSVNGWFHAPPVHRAERYTEPPLTLYKHVFMEQDKFLEWINPIYLEADVQTRIQLKVENDSEIELQGFLQEAKYAELVEALRLENIKWQDMGPPNKRCYQSTEETTRPPVVEECLSLFRSEAMFLTLSNLTGLTLHPLAAPSHHSDSSDDSESSESAEEGATASPTRCRPDQAKPRPKRPRLKSGSDSRADNNKTEDSSESSESSARCRYEVRRWSHGSYTLVHDTDQHGAEFCLDAMMFCGCKGWQQEFGGFTSYIARGEDEELLTIHPAENCLALVYRDKESLRFVKHINNRIHEMTSPDPLFYDLSFVYYE